MSDDERMVERHGPGTDRVTSESDGGMEWPGSVTGKRVLFMATRGDPNGETVEEWVGDAKFDGVSESDKREEISVKLWSAKTFLENATTLA